MSLCYLTSTEEPQAAREGRGGECILLEPPHPCFILVHLLKTVQGSLDMKGVDGIGMDDIKEGHVGMAEKEGVGTYKYRLIRPLSWWSFRMFP